MSKRIKILPLEVSGKIAAGEVVERPASVVKELVENSLDAGAKRIQVSVENACCNISVRDNGRGMTAAELSLAVQRFATSKIDDIDDLNRLHSFGFRGEALNAIAAVSKLRLRSRPEGQGEAAFVLVEGGVHSGDGIEGASLGTMLEVRELFYNTPARLKFLKAERTEKRHLVNTVARFVLSHPGVEFVLNMDGEETLNTAGCKQERDRLALVFTSEEARELVSLSGGNEMVSARGYLSPPGMHRRDRGGIYFFVNQRAVEAPLLAHVLRQSYQTLLPANRFPLAVVSLQLPADELDVNVHPTKREVRFRNGNLVHSALSRVMAEALRGIGQELGLAVEQVDGETRRQKPADDFWKKRGGVQEEIGGYLTGVSRHKRLTGTGRPAGERYLRGATPQDGEERLAEETPGVRVFGQVDCLYIVAARDDEVIIVDQHAAHERLLYQRLLSSGKSAAAQRLLSPERVELSVAEAETAKGCLEELSGLGLELEPFGGSSFVVNAVPVDFRGGELKDFLRRLLAELEALGSDKHQRRQAALKLMACHLAVRDGERLGMEEMRKIVEDILADPEGGRCPHGRPAYLRLTRDELDRKFKRK